jgi:hypothetical protein
VLLAEAKRLRDEREKHQAALAVYRHELADFSGLTKRLNTLPDEFERPNPDHVWAIFELSDRMASLEITGPSPLPWAIDLEQLATMRRLANNKQLTSVKELPAAVADDVRSMLALVKVSPHPFNLRGAAYALRLSGAAHLVAEGSDLYELVDAIVAGPDAQARHTLYAALIRAPETPAVAALIKQATRYFTPAEQVEAVQARLEFDPKIQKDVDSAIQTANDTLAQPNNVSPADVLSALMRFAPKDNDALLKELANKVTFSSIPAAQQDDAIVFVVGQAPFDPLAARWLDAQLLSSTQASLVSRTLEVLANATHGDDDDQPEQPAAEPTGSRPPPSLANVPRVRLKGRIEVDSVDHGLFRVLSHPDARIRDIAWRAVRHFAIAEQWRRSEEPAMAHTNPYERLTDAAITHRPTPTYAVKFLYSQPDALRAVEGVLRILLKGDADASELAARTVLGWNAPLDIVLDARSYTDREAFAQIIYDRLQQQKPLVTGLFAERIEKNPVVPWFGKQVMQGEVPAPSQYIDAYARPERLMELLSLKEEKVALGAFAALVAATGGDDLTARQYWPNIEKQTDKSVPSLRLVWVQTQREIVADVRRRLSGPYQLLITAPPNAEPGNPIANDPPIDLGQVDLVVTELGVKLQDKPMTLNIPQDENRMILRMERPAELKQNFTAPALYKVPIQRVLEALDLTLQNDGSWRGTAEIPGEEYSVVVTMKPLRTTP